MDSPLIIPLGCYVLVILVVAITQLVKIRDAELEVHQRLHIEEAEHQRKMRELELQLERVRQGQ